MALANYSELVTAIADWTARDDLTSYIDTFIALAEEMHRRPPSNPSDATLGGIRLGKTRTTGTLTAGTATLALPTDFLELDSFWLTGYGPLEFVSPNQRRQEYAQGNGLPYAFSISDVIEFDRAPDSDYAYEISYWPKVTGLSSTNATNDILTNYPLAYLSACLMHASRFVRDDENALAWAQQYRDAAWTASETYRRGRYSRGPISIRTARSAP